ncbi:hypothetical protein ACMWB4_27205, partial [Klebsiella pneumoniae]
REVIRVRKEHRYKREGMEGDRSLSRIYSSPDFIRRNIPAVEWVKGPPRKSIGIVPAGKRLAA